MELKLLTTKEKSNGSIINIYQIGNYKIVEESNSNYNFISVRVDKDASEYIPEIYTRDEDFKVVSFAIQTTSYGSLLVDEIEEVIKGFNEAVEVVKILTDKFVTAVK